MSDPTPAASRASHKILWIALGLVVVVVLYLLVFANIFAVKYDRANAEGNSAIAKKVAAVVTPTLDKAEYDRRMLLLANNPPVSASSTATSTPKLWPVKAAYPNPGALLPFKRIIAYYGNFYSTHMGVLGEYPAPEMLAKLNSEVTVWEAADPATPVVPAIDYIVTTAQGSPGADGKYRFRMPSAQIQHALDLAIQEHGILILDVQVGTSNVPAEIAVLEPYLKLPNVHLALDPEFSMKSGAKPGTEIGTMDATDINYAANFLAKLVRDNNLPPKVLVVHRFTGPMVTHAERIVPLPEVQIVMDMDGWGSPAKKTNTYFRTVYKEPVQFTGLKLFYKNDLKAPSTRLLTPAEVLKLQPSPSFIQYQ